MFDKQIAYGHEARKTMAKGVDKLNDAVKVTLGPLGRYVTFDKFDRTTPHSTKDGVSVAEQIFLPDPLEDLGAQMVKSAASRAGDTVGDGTTTTTVLTTAIVNQGLHRITEEDANPVRLAQGIRDAARVANQAISDLVKPVDSNEIVRHIATISANNDPEIGGLLAEAYAAAGVNGIIRVKQEAVTREGLNIPNGKYFARGYESPHFLPQGESVISLGETMVIQVIESIETLTDIDVHILAALVAQTNVVILSEDFGSEVLTRLVNISNAHEHSIVAVRSPGYGKRRKDIAEDLTVLLGGAVINKLSDLVVDENIDYNRIGKAETIRISDKRTEFTYGEVDQEKLETTIASIQEIIKDELADKFSRESAKVRLAMLDGKIVEIQVAAFSEVEFKERSDRYDDAVRAVDAAKNGGYLPGGCVAQINAWRAVRAYMNENEEKVKSNLAGWESFHDALLTPIRQILTNAGYTDAEGYNMIDKIILAVSENPMHGFDVKHETMGDMIEMGVIDPAKVTLEAISIAASTASTLLTTDAAITNIKENG